MSFAFVTLLTSDEYLPGAICLSKSLFSKYPLVILAVPERLSTTTVNALYSAYDSVIFVPEINSDQFTELDLLGRRDLNCTLTKIHCFNPQLIKYDRICFLDADILVLEDIDRIFDYLNDPEVMFAASPDVGWPDCFNSGVFVTRPLPSLYLGLLDLHKNVGSFDGGDQGLLNSFFSSWSGHANTNAPKSVRLPFTFNVTPTAFYSYLPAFAEFNDKISCVHFIGKEKPWHYERFADGGIVPRLRGTVAAQTLRMIHDWWSAFEREERIKIVGLDRFTKSSSKKPNLKHKVSWGSQEVHHADITKPQSCNKEACLVSSLEKNSFDSENSPQIIGELQEEVNVEGSKQTPNQSVIETPYQVFEKTVSAHAKKVEENPPESFADYKISWNE